MPRNPNLTAQEELERKKNDRWGITKNQYMEIWKGLTTKEKGMEAASNLKDIYQELKKNGKAPDQVSLANALGLTPASVSRQLNGVQPVRVELAIQYAELLNVEPRRIRPDAFSIQPPLASYDDYIYQVDKHLYNKCKEAVASSIKGIEKAKKMNESEIEDYANIKLIQLYNYIEKTGTKEDASVVLLQMATAENINRPSK